MAPIGQDAFLTGITDRLSASLTPLEKGIFSGGEGWYDFS